MFLKIKKIIYLYNLLKNKEVYEVIKGDKRTNILLYMDNNKINTRYEVDSNLSKTFNMSLGCNQYNIFHTQNIKYKL